MTVNIQDYITENILNGYIINDSLYEGFYIIFKDAPTGIVEYCNYIGRFYNEIKFNLSPKTLFEYFLRTDYDYESCENNQFLLNDCEIKDYIGFIPEDDCDFYEILFEPEEQVLKELQRESTDNGRKNSGLDCFDYVFTLLFKIPDKKIHIQFTARELFRFYLFFEVFEKYEIKNNESFTNHSEYITETSWNIKKYKDIYKLTILNTDETYNGFDDFCLTGQKEDFIKIFKPIFQKHIEIIRNKKLPL